ISQSSRSCWHFFFSTAPSLNPKDRWIRYGDYCVRPYHYSGAETFVRMVKGWERAGEIVIRKEQDETPMNFREDLTLLTHA
ncbi:hypothetical protein PFISCL1PPCAC_13176, partial [Pristionchus fissidentatus]